MVSVDYLLDRGNFKTQVKTIFPKGITGIYGPSGSGKTTLLNVIAGLDKPDTGSIEVGDHTLFDSEANIHTPISKRNVGYVFQEGRLFPHLSVEQNLKYGIKPEKASQFTFKEVIDLLQIQHLLSSRPAQLSGGEQQRVAIGRALLSSPAILLLDEPFSALDTQLRDQILPFIYQIHQRIEIPILVVSHDLSELLKLSQNLLCLQHGQCVGHGNFIDLIKQPETHAVFGNRPLINCFEMQPVLTDKDEDLTTLKWQYDKQDVFVKCQRTAIEHEGSVRVFLNADDISLSLHQVEQVTTQNQLSGKVTQLIPRNQAMICIVNVGFPLIVEITRDSQKRLNIQVGTSLWCLFKSVAIGLA
ncbi:MAG: molybdenum ABC transporter ATP-binding protein [Cytophagales bacterium]|nr:molybdenum ABC transporter ATP-binding protein [Cytophagales bacterium]